MSRQAVHPLGSFSPTENMKAGHIICKDKVALTDM